MYDSGNAFLNLHVHLLDVFIQPIFPLLTSKAARYTAFFDTLP